MYKMSDMKQCFIIMIIVVCVWCIMFQCRIVFNFILLPNKCGHRKVLSKWQVWMSILHINNFEKKFMDTGVLDFFNKKLILDYNFCLKSGPVFLLQIVIIPPPPPPPPPLPRDIKCINY